MLSHLRHSYPVPVAVLGLLAAAACSDSVAPTPAITGMEFRVMTAEAEGFRNVMLVGDSGTAIVTVHNGDRGVSADRVGIAFTSSDSTVVALGPQVGGYCRLRALKPGSVYIAARVGTFRDSAQVEVLAEPLSVDQIIVTLAPISRDLDATFDAAGSLSTLTLPVGGSAALWMDVRRNGQIVDPVPFTITSSNPAVAQGTLQCRPVELDPRCDVFSHWGWVSAMGVGESTIVVTVRGVQATFTVTVGP